MAVQKIAIYSYTKPETLMKLANKDEIIKA